ncbi:MULTISPECIES: citrate synthase [Halolamina]|uniref:Citrate synthase n=1 Tax=Halolamina pelagica TaxID=699431 RepID=A0A1I5TZ78_9EURY|nr:MULTISPECIES: citrate synthase [Halolamina]NHX36707.1 citrate synthase [Halolamina sp. R1-12]SFP88211.1 citrate synthase [Halolamina pelagica]
MSGEVQKGLEGVVVGESQLSYINGDEGRLIYRGHEIETLAEHATYEEVLYLLWHGSLPTESELAEFTATMAEERAVDDEVLGTLADLAAADEAPMAALRTAVSMLSASDPEPDAAPDDQAATLRQGRRITAKVPTILAAYQRLRDGEEPLSPKEDLSHAGNFLYMLTGEEPDDVAEETLDMALILHADHGLNASTFASMVIASTLADTYAAVTGGVGALSGPLHGGANQDVMETLLEVDDSSKDPVQWVKDAIDDGRKIPGFGHRVYNVKDPRAVILEEKSRDLGDASGERKWYDHANEIEQYLVEEAGFAEKGLAPNVDFYSGTVYYQLGIPVDMFTPIFAMSRVGGWVAHVIEQLGDNRIFRPRAKYTGAKEAEWTPVEDR